MLAEVGVQTTAVPCTCGALSPKAAVQPVRGGGRRQRRKIYTTPRRKEVRLTRKRERERETEREKYMNKERENKRKREE